MTISKKKTDLVTLSSSMRRFLSYTVPISAPRIRSRIFEIGKAKGKVTSMKNLVNQIVWAPTANPWREQIAWKWLTNLWPKVLHDKLCEPIWFASMIGDNAFFYYFQQKKCFFYIKVTKIEPEEWFRRRWRWPWLHRWRRQCRRSGYPTEWSKCC